ncbi:MAG: hypothetical protein WBP79_16305 [Candidatus Acidiferrales bacterium]
MRIRALLFPGVLVLVCTAGLSGQKAHRLEWKTGSSPNVFDQVEQQGEAGKQPSSLEQTAIRHQRQTKMAELSRELGDIIHSASDLQERLKATDPNKVVSVELLNQGKQLEEAARKVHKKISSL